MSQPPDPELAILHARARRLAAPVAPIAHAATLPTIVFRRGEERYAVEALAIAEVLRQPIWRRLPRTPTALAGILVVRGSVIPLFDLQPLLGLPPRPLEHLGAAVLVASPAAPFAIATDEVTAVREVAAELEPAPARLDAATRRWVRGMTSDAVVVIDALALGEDDRLWISHDAPEVPLP